MIDFEVLRKRESLLVTRLYEPEFKLQIKSRNDLIGGKFGTARPWQVDVEKGFLYQNKDQIYAVKVTENREMTRTYQQSINSGEQENAVREFFKQDPVKAEPVDQGRYFVSIDDPFACIQVQSAPSSIFLVNLRA